MFEGKRKNEKVITGKTLIDLGYKPAKWFGEVIEYANKKGLADQALINYIESVRPHVIEPHKRSLGLNLLKRRYDVIKTSILDIM